MDAQFAQNQQVSDCKMCIRFFFFFSAMNNQPINPFAKSVPRNYMTGTMIPFVCPAFLCWTHTMLQYCANTSMEHSYLINLLFHIVLLIFLVLNKRSVRNVNNDQFINSNLMQKKLGQPYTNSYLGPTFLKVQSCSLSPHFYIPISVPQGLGMPVQLLQIVTSFQGLQP